MLNEGAPDCLLPITRKGSDDIIDSHRSHSSPSHRQNQPSYSNHLLKKWTERVDRCLEQQWKDSQHLLSFAKTLKDSGGAIINSDDLVKELSGLGFAMMQRSIDLRQEIVNESYNNDFFDCHIKKPAYQYHHDKNTYNSQSHSSQMTGVGVLNSPRQKCSSTFYLPFSSQLNHHTPLLSKGQKQANSVDPSPYKIPSQVSCEEYTPSYTYQHRQQRTRADSFTTQRQQPTSPSDKKIGIPLLSSSPSISNVCGLSLQGKNDVIKNQQQHNDSSNKSDTLQHQCACNTNTSIELSAIRCQHCTPSQLPRKDSASIQATATQSAHHDNSAPCSDIEDTPAINDNDNSRLCDTIDDDHTAEDEDSTTPPLLHRPSSPSDDTDNATTLTSATETTSKTNTSILLSLTDDTTTAVATTTGIVAPVAPVAPASLAVHITPSTPSSSSSMVHTMSTKFHFTRSTTSVTSVDRNKTMSRSSSSSSSASLSSVSLLETTPLNRLSNKDGDGKSSTRLVQSLLGRKTSLPALFFTSKKDHPLSSPKNVT